MNIFLDKDEFTMLNYNAAGFALAYRELMLTHKNHNDLYDTDKSIFFFPAIVNMSFAIELSLKKCLERQEKNKNSQGHKLNKLFEKLNPETQNEIITTTIEMSKLKCRLLGNKDILKKESFLILLKEHQDAFVEWRYFHEGKKIKSRDIDFLEELMYALTMSIEEYEWYLNEMIDLRTDEEKKHERLKKIFEIELVKELRKHEDMKSKEQVVEMGSRTMGRIAHLLDLSLSEVNDYFIKLIDK